MATSSKTQIGTEDVYLTVADVAKLDRCSEKTVRRAITAGLLEAVRIGPGGRLIRISREAHEAYRCRVQP